VRAHWESQGDAVRDEVPLHGRYADLLVQHEDELIAVELKLEDWREALAQAMHYQVAAHKSYIAMPLHGAALPLRSRSRLERQGVGLLAVHPLGDVRTLVEAKGSTRRLPFFSDHIREQWFGASPPPSAVPPHTRLGTGVLPLPSSPVGAVNVATAVSVGSAVSGTEARNGPALPLPMAGAGLSSATALPQA